jgi:hypothetical protein
MQTKIRCHPVAMAFFSRFWFDAAITEARYQVNRFPPMGNPCRVSIQGTEILIFI